MTPDQAVATRPSNARPSATKRYEAGFWFVAISYLLVMAVGTLPSPLYGLYQHRDGFSTFTITLIFAANSAGSAVSLFLVGHLSDWHGRKRVLLPGLALSASSALVFVLWRSLPGLYVGRVLTGLSIGAVSGTATAYLIELHTRSRSGASIRRAQLVGTVANVGGLGAGALVAGLLAQYVSSPLTVPYVVFLVALGVMIAAVALTPETREGPIPQPSYRPQRIAVPAHARSQFFAATGGAAIAFAALGLFTSLAGVFLVGTLRHSSQALAGATVFAVFGGAVTMQFISMTWTRRLVLLSGMGILLTGLGLVVLAAWLSAPSLALFLVGGFVSGLGAGALFKGSLGTVMIITAPEHRAESVAGVLLAGYIGLSAPVVGIGVALQEGLSTKDTLLGFALAVAIAVLATAPALLRTQSAGIPSAPGVPSVNRGPDGPPALTRAPVAPAPAAVRRLV
jgi:MFS family permease